MNLKQALEIIDSGEVFSLKVVSYDKKRKTSGELKFYSQLCTSVPKQDRTKMVNTESKAQNHYENSTRNCYRCIEGEPTSAFVKIHIYLMLEVNGERVML